MRCVECRIGGFTRQHVHQNAPHTTDRTTPHTTPDASPSRSEMRQVPDNQEVFVDGASDASLILELLELERGRPGPEVRTTGVHGGRVVG